MTEQTQPTDAALEALAKDLRERAARCDAPGNELYVLGLREAAEAVINAKWGAPAGAGGDRMADGTRRMIEGMSVSIDVSTGDHDAGRRYFGTVTEVMDCNGDKHGVTLLVQDAEPNFTPQPTQAQAGAVPLQTVLIDGTAHQTPKPVAATLVEVLVLLEEVSDHDSYETEYDGRMIYLCPECGSQDGEHSKHCAYRRAKDRLAALKLGADNA